MEKNIEKPERYRILMGIHRIVVRGPTKLYRCGVQSIPRTREL